MSAYNPPKYNAVTGEWYTSTKRPLVLDGGVPREMADVERVELGDAAFKDTGTTSGTVAAGDHAHIGTYEPADATILKSAAIGVSVQAYDADIPTVAATQAEMEAGTESGLRSMSPLRVAQAISALGSSGSLTAVAYDDRGNLRTDETSGWAVVDGLGLFQYVAGSSEPDDDESCFATTNGRWLLQCAHWDVVDSWQLPDDEVRDAADEDTEARLDSAETRLDSAETRLDSAETRWPGRILFGTAASSVTSLAAVTQTSFTGTVTGAAAGDHVVATPPDALGARISAHARVTANNTVTVYLNNASSAAQSLSAGTWQLAVIQES